MVFFGIGHYFISSYLFEMMRFRFNFNPLLVIKDQDLFVDLTSTCILLGRYIVFVLLTIFNSII